MRKIVLWLLLISCMSRGADAKGDRTMIYLLDPRGAVSGRQVMSTEWQGRKADVLGSRILNVREARQLKAILRKELVDDDNIPFCGHSPGYAVVVTTSGKKSVTVTLCGTCGTWAKGGELRALHGKKSLEFLDSLLPVPAVFRSHGGGASKHLDPFAEEAPVPFSQMEDAADG